MKVTPLNKKFGKYAPGDVFDFPDGPAKVFIKIGKLSAVVDAPTLTQTRQTYSTRMMTAAVAGGVVSETKTPAAIAGTSADESAEAAPYGYKADGTPRKRPGRPVAGHE